MRNNCCLATAPIIRVGGLAALENRGDVGRAVLLRQLAQHVIEDVDRFGGEPRAGPHRRSAGSRARMVSAKDKSEGVDEKQLLSGHCAHHTIGRAVLLACPTQRSSDPLLPPRPPRLRVKSTSSLCHCVSDNL